MVRRLAHKESRKWRRSLTRMRTIDRRMPTALTRTVTTVRMRICSIQIWRTLRGARNQRSTTPVAQNTCTDSTNWSWSLFSFTTTREICRRRVRNSSICSWKMASKSSKNTQMIRMLAKPWGSNRSKWPRSKTWEMKARPMGWWCHRNSRLWRKSNKTVKGSSRSPTRQKETYLKIDKKNSTPDGYHATLRESNKQSNTYIAPAKNNKNDDDFVKTSINNWKLINAILYDRYFLS